MPEQLDWCAECNAPIFMERVAGACSCRAGALRALQVSLLRGKAPCQVKVGSFQNRPNLTSILMAEARRDLGIQEDFEHMEREIRAGLGVPEPVVRPANCPPALPPNFNLESLWTNEEIEDIFGPVVNANGRPDSTSPDEIQFDSGEDIEFENLPQRVGGEETRFRVDRGLPQREPFRGNLEPGAQGGPMREVGSIRGYAVLREQRFAGLGPGERYYASEPEFVGRFPERQEIPVTPRPTPRTASTAEKPVHRPTVYERLRNDDFLDDD